ncbi:MAG: sulfurtransferase [Nitrospirae bacterium]|nr:sulfurtransferase [Nitrospirota bacterium]
MTHPLLIDTESLQRQLGQSGVVIIDVRGKAAYEFGGHIPGAVHSTWHEYSDPSAVAKGLLNPNLGEIERILQRLGINQDSEVVIYSNPFDNWGDEGRMFWMLDYLGHTRLRLKGLVRGPHPQTAILDARSVEEYLGKEVSGIPRPGHIPSAIHVAWNGFLNKDATVKDLSVIREMLAAKGIDNGQDVICYCTGGVRSAWLYFILKLVGYSKLRNKCSGLIQPPSLLDSLEKRCVR